MKINMKNIAVAASAIAFAMAPEAAHAFTAGYNGTPGGADIAGQISQMANQSSGTPALIAWGGYIIGTFFVAVGIFKLKAHSDNAAQNKLGPALGLLFTGAAFLVMPAAAKMFIDSSKMTGTVDKYSSTAFQ